MMYPKKNVDAGRIAPTFELGGVTPEE